ncbi:MAG: formyltransferase family protein, partial [Chromatocurvus sp.]
MTGTVDRLPRLAILASGAGSNMQAITDACSAGIIPARVVVVGSNRPGPGVLDRARRAGIGCLVV